MHALPIPAALWQRLARLDARCDFDLARRDVAPPDQRHASGRNYTRMWVVRVWERGQDRWVITAEGAYLAQALEGAVVEAEQRGWAAPARAVPA